MRPEFTSAVASFDVAAMPPLELDVLPAIQAIEAFTAICCGAVGAWIQPAALVSVLWRGNSMPKVAEAALPPMWISHGDSLHSDVGGYGPLLWGAEDSYSLLPIPTPFQRYPGGPRRGRRSWTIQGMATPHQGLEVS